jgi:hypothetical protein
MRSASVILLVIGWLVAAPRLAELRAQEKKNAGDNVIPAEFNKALEAAKSLDLYSLDPNTPVEKGNADFHGWKVLGKTELKNEPLAKLLAAFKKGAHEANRKVSAGCFRPRHGIRVRLDGSSYDFVICFECVAVMLYKDREADGKNGFHVSKTPAEIFNQFLKEANVKLPEQPRE